MDELKESQWKQESEREREKERASEPIGKNSPSDTDIQSSSSGSDQRLNKSEIVSRQDSKSTEEEARESNSNAL